MLITASMNRLFGACYSDRLLSRLYGPDGKTPQQVAAMDVPIDDRLWILWRVMGKFDRTGCRECLARMFDRYEQQRMAQALRSDTSLEAPQHCGQTEAEVYITKACVWAAIYASHKGSPCTAADAGRAAIGAAMSVCRQNEEREKQLADLLEFLNRLE